MRIQKKNFRHALIWVGIFESLYFVANCTHLLGIQGVECQKKMCWETSVGIEFYKLTVFDIIIQFAVVLFMDIPR